MKKTHLILIDPQCDFCDKRGTLFVPGADDDMVRLTDFINKNKNRITDVHCTLDSHDPIHIAHPQFWTNSKGQRPNPFTLITEDDVKNGVWRAFNPKLQARALDYVSTLAKNKRYVLVIWPPHCLIGSWGASVVPSVHAALTDWASEKFNRVNWVTKGSNFLTEHYSAVQADVPDPADASTKINTNLIDALVEADEILITGEALSHCVASTIRDVADNFGEDNIKKFILLQDTTSSVPGFENLGNDFIIDLTKRGMRVIKTTDY